MRDIDRIPKILNEIERIWKANPDFRLGQLLVIATKPQHPCPAVFNIEDENLMDGLLSFDYREESKLTEANPIPDWKKYPNVTRVNTDELSIELLIKLLNSLKNDDKRIVITPINLMLLNGAPVADQT